MGASVVENVEKWHYVRLRRAAGVVMGEGLGHSRYSYNSVYRRGGRGGIWELK